MNAFPMFQNHLIAHRLMLIMMISTTPHPRLLLCYMVRTVIIGRVVAHPGVLVRRRTRTAPSPQ